MAGGMHSKRGPGQPLWSRAAADAGDGDPGRRAAASGSAAGGSPGRARSGTAGAGDARAEADGTGVPATPCWVATGARQPGSVLAWRRASDGTWQALVVAWLPADRVRPRADGSAGDGEDAG